jgi:hypothetical protein
MTLLKINHKGFFSEKHIYENYQSEIQCFNIYPKNILDRIASKPLYLKTRFIKTIGNPESRHTAPTRIRSTFAQLPV